MRTASLTIASLCLAALPAAPLFAQTAPRAPAAPSSACIALAADWTRIEQNLADNLARGLGDNSAPRATLRAMEDGNELAAAAITLDLMRDNRCPLPRRAPQSATYLGSALECATARLRIGSGDNPPACDRSTWTAVR